MRNLFHAIGRAINAHPRSSKWPAKRKEHLEKEPACIYCGGTDSLQVHHIRPYHLDPALELADDNLATLCEAIGKNCHIRVGHFGNWKEFNPAVRSCK